MARQQKDATFDASLALKAAGAITANTAGSLVLDLGASRIDARVIVDVSAIVTGTADNLYAVELQLSNDNTFATGMVNTQNIKLGHQTMTGATAASAVGRYEIGVSNEQNGVTYRYARIFTRAAGTTPSINYVANLVIDA